MEDPIHPEVETPLRLVEAQLVLMAGQAAKVRAVAADLEAALARHPEHEAAVVERLGALVRKKKGAAVREAGALLERRSRAGCASAVPHLLAARERGLRAAAVGLALDLVAHGDTDLVPLLARQAQDDSSLLANLAAPLAALPRPQEAPSEAQGLEAFLAAGAPALRQLAAGILDLEGPVGPERAARVLGPAAIPLAPWLEWTRASASDLVALVPTPGHPPPVATTLAAAEATLGPRLLGEVLALLGWERVCWGLDVHTWVGLRLGASPLLVLTPAEADLVQQAVPAEREWVRHVVVAQGGLADSGQEAGDEKMATFRSYNLAHAAALTEIMEVAPLDAARARRLLALCRGLVRDYCALFAEHTEDVHPLPRVLAGLEEAISPGLEGLDDATLLDPELTRLVLMFEDPSGVMDIRTLHGLKRFVHQSGLRLAFRLFRSGRAANRTVDLVVCTPERVLSEARRIRFIDFEPGEGLPLPVRWAVEGFARCMLQGRTSLPAVEVLGYGNEVQVYVSFRNHPAFVRLDLSPPQRGGMIDLEYFGVSQYELDQHPDHSLHGIQEVFRREEFDTDADGLRLHFRYDKERAFDLGDLVRKARALFRVVPWLMDLDWVLGGLDLPLPARRLVATAWADHLARWGALPESELLSADRRGVVVGTRPDPAGDVQLTWSGRGVYTDRFTPPGPELLEGIRGVLAARGLEHVAAWEEERGQGACQLTLERAVLRPLRRAVERGEVLPDLSGPQPGFSREHEAVRLARVLASGHLAGAARLAAVVRTVERSLRFLTTGAVQGRPVQRALVPLREGTVGLLVLRDDQGIARLATAAWGGVLQEGVAAPGPEDVEPLLRRDNYLVGEEPRADEDLEALAASLTAPSAPAAPPHPDERQVPVLAAAPGRASGFARFRGPERDGAVLVTAALRPEDAPAMRRCAAVVSTGGGVLSHAGLVALELRKPAAIAAGRWVGEDRLVLRRPVFREEQVDVGFLLATCRRDIREVEVELVEGDLMVVDADGGALTVLGQGTEALTLHDDLVLLRDAAAAADSDDPAVFLASRGRLLKAAHQLRRLLSRLERPDLARYAATELLTSGTHHARDLLASLFNNPAVGALARQAAVEHRVALEAAAIHASRTAISGLPRSRNGWEVVDLRTRVRRVEASLAGVCRLLGTSPLPLAPVDEPARARLHTLAGEGDPLALRLLGHPAPPPLARAPDLPLLGPDAPGDLQPRVGAKAANLARMGRILGAERVPPWFAVADAAFHRVMDAPVDGVPLRDRIRAAQDAEADPARASLAVRALWESTPLPVDLEAEVVAAYRALGPGDPWVAVRSSTLEEDTEEAAWAGQFDTFLYVRGASSVVEHLRLAWAGIWTPRAIHQRRALGRERLGGGIVVQRMVDSRVSGVLHTVSAATGRLDEMVVNVGLGLGEGVVSGLVEVDQVTVSKDRDLLTEPLRLRYTVGDKTTRVERDDRRGGGTRVAETLYHERLRPALEYVELEELVRAAARLEDRFRQPLDVEFAFEGSTLYVLQARPVGLFSAALRETLDRFPLGDP